MNDFCRKMALFLLIIWWFREKVVPLHTFSRSANAHAHDVRSARGEKVKTERGKMKTEK